MNRSCLKIISAVMILLNLFVRNVQADIGPKPSVTLFIDGVDENKTYYVTLLARQEHFGPWSRIESEGNAEESEDFRIFAAYQDPDGFFFAGQHSLLENGTYTWSYYPPDVFKIAIYCLEDKTLLVSDIYERTAFDSCFRVSYDKSGLQVAEEDHLGRSILSGFLRAAATILIELFLAYLFGYRKKKQVLIIVITNLITQLFLNLFLVLCDYYGGLLVWLLMFFLGELIVIIIEEIVYMLGFKGVKKGWLFFYGLLANLLSAALTFILEINQLV